MVDRHTTSCFAHSPTTTHHNYDKAPQGHTPHRQLSGETSSTLHTDKLIGRSSYGVEATQKETLQEGAVEQGQGPYPYVRHNGKANVPALFFFCLQSTHLPWLRPRLKDGREGGKGCPAYVLMDSLLPFSMLSPCASTTASWTTSRATDMLAMSLRGFLSIS
jgi:hypothetical protein